MEENLDINKDSIAINTKQHIKIVEVFFSYFKDHIEIANESCIEYQNQIEEVRTQLKVANLIQMQQVDDVLTSLLPLYQNSMRELTQSIIIQKEENKRQQLNITQLKKNAFDIQQEINETELNAQKLQDVIGDYLQNLQQQ